jgi:1-acyl-sn-glycerol-3-phosphate acyltransferase
MVEVAWSPYQRRSAFLLSAAASPGSTIPAWPRRRIVRVLRALLQVFVLFPMLRIGYGIEVRGAEHLRGLGPCLLISNHNMHLDWSMLLRALPWRFRRRVAVAGAADDIFGARRRALTAGLLGNAFPFERDGSGIRESLEDVQGLLGAGWSILMFPEGKLTVCGPTQPFKSGVAWLAVKAGVPVVPIRVDVLRPGMWESGWFPNPRGRVRVTVGEPIRLAPDSRHAEAVVALQEAVARA